jgi:hypothetical protein
VTCIVGIAGTKGVLLAGDSQWSGYNMKGMDTDSKVFMVSPIMAMGCCGSGRTMQILKHCIADGLDDPGPEEDLRRWYVREFQPRIAGTLEHYGALFRYRDDNVEELGDSAFLLAIRDRLFCIESDFSINESFRPFVGLASGGETSTGGLYTQFELVVEKGQVKEEGPVSKSWEWMEDVARRSIEAAAATTPYVGGPIRFVRTEIYTPDEKALAKAVLNNEPTPRKDEGWYE